MLRKIQRITPHTSAFWQSTTVWFISIYWLFYEQWIFKYTYEFISGAPCIKCFSTYTSHYIYNRCYESAIQWFNSFHSCYFSEETFQVFSISNCKILQLISTYQNLRLITDTFNLFGRNQYSITFIWSSNK